MANHTFLYLFFRRTIFLPKFCFFLKENPQALQNLFHKLSILIKIQFIFVEFTTTLVSATPGDYGSVSSAGSILRCYGSVPPKDYSDKEASEILMASQGRQSTSGKFDIRNILAIQENNNNNDIISGNKNQEKSVVVLLNNQEHQTNLGDKNNQKSQNNTENRDTLDAQTSTNDNDNRDVKTIVKDSNNLDDQANIKKPNEPVIQTTAKNIDTVIVQKLPTKSDYIRVSAFNGNTACQVLDKKFGETLKKLGDYTNQLKRKLNLLMEENARIKRQCNKYQQDYSELKAKYDKTLQQLATEKSNELNRITSQKLLDLRELERLSENLKTILDETEAGNNILEENEIDDDIITNNDTDAQENSPELSNSAVNNKDSATPF
ncbi:hypothetical protein RCL_jg24403.t1 [Rhizophagus clarus]|uniref:Uncharacterized protein n=1 Tax=Rhizophagus clarus TaxID=94130 RepID=A0A8H3R4T4_9GLOM|nr:hypothetical protein RCL_jg24403.t1 [Rhizophagus clarus]